MIPKIIHYCWFSNEKKTRLIQQCIDSWTKTMPDYTIKCWDGNSFDFDSVDFVREAMAAKKYAFAADYVRLHALYTEGGIYLDSDVFVKRPFDIFLSNSLFCGTEAYWADGELRYRMEPAIMGAEKGHHFLEQCMSFYMHNRFSSTTTCKEDIMPNVVSRYATEHGYYYENKEQHLQDLTIYPTSYFTNTLHKDTSNVNELYAIHQNAGSWIDYQGRGWLFNYCRKHNLMNLYHRLEKILNRK